MEHSDPNGNRLPAIYTRNTTNASNHISRVLWRLDDLLAMGYDEISVASHFDKCMLGPVHHQKCLEDVIFPLVDKMKNSPQNDDCVVFVYDINDITMLSEDHFAELNELIPETNWYPLFSAVHSLSTKINLPQLKGYSDPKYRANFERFKQSYDSISEKFDRKRPMISEELLKSIRIVGKDEKQVIRHIVVEHQKVFHQRWKAVEKCFKWAQKMSKKTNKKYANVVICKDIAQGAAELLFSRLSSPVGIDNVFSTNSILFPDPVFQRIQQRFGQSCVMIHVTSCEYRDSFHGNLNIPVWSVTSTESFKQLYRAQRDYLSSC